MPQQVSTLALSPQLAIALFAVALPFGLWAIWSDLSRLIIPNRLCLAFLALSAAVLFAYLPLDAFAWRMAQGLGVLAVGMVFFLSGAVGGGDAKYTAVAAPLIHPDDAPAVLMALAVMMLAAFAAHRIVRATQLRNLAPGWKSWTSQNAFPMALPLASTLIYYLARAAF